MIFSPNLAFVAEPTVGAAELEASAIAANEAISATVTTVVHTTRPDGRPRPRVRAVCCDSRSNMLLLPPPVAITAQDADSAITFRRVSGRIHEERRLEQEDGTTKFIL
jgi:hypothetical protein